MKRVLLLILVFIVACAKEEESRPEDTVKDYLNARVKSDVDEMRKLSCAEWEQQAILQADSFRAMNASVEGLACEKNGEDGDFTLIACEGKIVSTYNGENREWPIPIYRLVQEDDEWKICGEGG